MDPIVLTINGRRAETIADPDTPLLYVLRNDLGLKGTKFGCGAGACGACMVHVDGRPEPSCILPISAVGGKPVTTIESLSEPDGPDRLQRAFIEAQAGQCGYCLSGILMTARALLDQNPDPTRDEIRCRPRRPHLSVWRDGSDGPRGRARRERRRLMTATGLPSMLAAHPRIGDWFDLAPDGRITAYSGKVEYGQGIRTALAQIVAHELELPIEMVTVAPVDTRRSPDEGVTSGSRSIEESNEGLRVAAAELRDALRREAARDLGVASD